MIKSDIRLLSSLSDATGTLEALEYLGLGTAVVLNGTKDGLTGAASRSQVWDFDELGNFDSVATDGASAVTRTHNRQNEITGIPGATTPTYDANGNLTRDESGNQYVYDAWDRLAEVKDSGGVTLVEYEYDGLSRRIEEVAGGSTTDLYYTPDWQVVEERVDGDVAARYVWSPVYVDALILRDRDANGVSSDGLEERLWAQQDANFNVTALTDGSGSVVERYVYDPFGGADVLTAGFATRAGSGYDWVVLFQGLRRGEGELFHARNRDLSGSLGRWLTNDPIRFRASDVNLYAFVGNRLLVANDPTGLLATSLNGCFKMPKVCASFGIGAGGGAAAVGGGGAAVVGGGGAAVSAGAATTASVTAVGFSAGPVVIGTVGVVGVGGAVGVSAAVQDPAVTEAIAEWLVESEPAVDSTGFPDEVREYANQTCPNFVLRALQRAKNLACNHPSVRDCGGMSEKKRNKIPCSKLRRLLAESQACLAACWEVQNRCFGGKPDQAHANEITSATNRIGNIENQIKINCAEGHRMAEL